MIENMIFFKDLGLPKLVWQDALDIGILTFLLYKSIMMVKGTRALAAILGLCLLILLYILSIYLQLYATRWVLQYIVASLFLVIIILFQKDIRQGLGVMGARYFWGSSTLRRNAVDEIVQACVEMARMRIGALIVIERSLPLEDMIRQEGTRIDGIITNKLLQTIFRTNCPLHDGAVIVSKGKISAAACILPLAVVRGRNFGTRHRAALGITEETDALAIVVSEERGEISVASNGQLTQALTANKLAEVLSDAL